MKKLVLFLSFAIGMIANAQVVQNQVFSTTEEISFVSDNGGGTYTVSGPGAGDNGFLAIYDENMPPNSRWEVKDFPPRSDLGSVHEAYTHITYTLQDGSSFAVGKIASSSSSDWYGVRKYNANSQIYSHEKVVKDVAGIFLYRGNNDIYLVIGKTSTTDLLNSGWNMQGEGWFIGKLNPQDLSLEWSYRLGNSWNTDWQLVYIDPLISTNKAYRYAVQQLPNGNIAVTVVRLLSGQTPDREYQLWEFNPATGQKLGVIDDSYTDYDRDGNYELQYRFHRWKVVNGVLFHEFWQDPAAYPDDQQIGHWEKLEVPGYTPSSSGHTAGWTSAGLELSAMSDEGTFDSFRKVVQDFWITQNGEISFIGKAISSETFSTIKDERINYFNTDARDFWYRSNGDRMVMDSHGLYKVRYNEVYSQRITLNPNGNSVVDARDDEYWNSEWQARYGEGTLVLSGTLPSVGSAPDPSWWSIPQDFHWSWNSNIMESHRPTDNGRRYFIVEAESDSNNPRAYLEYRVWVVDANAVSVPETEISGLSLYPNPVENFLTVSADDDIDTVRIYNLLGVIVSESNTNSVYMGNLAHGVYVAEVISGDKMSRKKVIKK